MNKILPAYIPKNKAALLDWLSSVTYTDTVQVDFVDGVFATPASWVPKTPEDFSGLPWSRVMLDLMVEEGESFFLENMRELYAVPEVVFHLKAIKDFSLLAVIRQTYKGSMLLAITNEDVASDSFTAAAESMPLFDGIQIMGIEKIGIQGEAFSKRTPETIATVRTMYPTLPIIIDGGMSAETLPAVIAAGASRAVVGSALLYTSDQSAHYQTLVALFPSSPAKVY